MGHDFYDALIGLTLFVSLAAMLAAISTVL